MISGSTALYGLVGHPVGHSLSPAMQNAAFGALSIDAVYVALPVEPGRLGEALRGAHALGFRGLNVTVPHKQEAARACDRLDDTARACGAANTLRRGPQGWEGFNTDAPACRELFRAAGLTRGGRALLLGAGGAALAAAWGLAAEGLEVLVAARRAEQAAAVCSRMAVAHPNAPPARAVRWRDAAMASEGVDAVVNATSIGLAEPGVSGAGASGPAATGLGVAQAAPSAHVPRPSSALPELRLRPGQVVADLVYGRTELVRRARAAAATLVTGEDVLLRQGALAFTLWTGRNAPETVMAAALRAGREPT